MYPKTIIVFLLVLLSTALQAQFKNSNNNAMNTGLIPLTAGDFVNTFDTHVSKLQGSVYFSDNWSRSNIVLKSDKLAEGYFSRYDLQNFSLEIRVEDKIYELTGSMVKEFTLDIEGENGQLERAHFINPMIKGKWQENIPMFLQSLAVKGQYELYLGAYTVVKPPNYNVALDVGSKDPIITKKEHYYLFDGKTFSRIPTKKKDFSKFFGQFNKNMPAIIKKNKWSPKEKEDILKTVAALNK